MFKQFFFFNPDSFLFRPPMLPSHLRWMGMGEPSGCCPVLYAAGDGFVPGRERVDGKDSENGLAINPSNPHNGWSLKIWSP